MSRKEGVSSKDCVQEGEYGVQNVGGSRYVGGTTSTRKIISHIHQTCLHTNISQQLPVTF